MRLKNSVLALLVTFFACQLQIGNSQNESFTKLIFNLIKIPLTISNRVMGEYEAKHNIENLTASLGRSPLGPSLSTKLSLFYKIYWSIGGSASEYTLEKILNETSESMSLKKFEELEKIFSDDSRNIVFLTLLNQFIEKHSDVQNMTTDLQQLESEYETDFKNHPVIDLSKLVSRYRNKWNSFITNYVKLNKINSGESFSPYFGFFGDLKYKRRECARRRWRGKFWLHDKLVSWDGDMPNNCFPTSMHSMIAESYIYLAKLLSDSYSKIAVAYSDRYREFADAYGKLKAENVMKNSRAVIQEYLGHMKTLMSSANWALGKSSRTAESNIPLHLIKGENYDYFNTSSKPISICTDWLQTDPGFVVTGAALKMKNGILFVEIEQGKFIGYNRVDAETVKWQEKKFCNSIQAIERESLRVLLGGVSFAPERLVTGLNIEIIYGMLSFFVHTVSQIHGETELHQVKETHFLANDPCQEVDMNGADPAHSPVDSDVMTFGNRHCVTIQAVDINGSEMTVPYIDTQEVITRIPAPINSLEIIYKAVPDHIGFLSLRVSYPDFSEMIDERKFDEYARMFDPITQMKKSE